jgi:hypothetical protein
MQDLETMAKELRKNGKAEGIRALADSADGQKLGQMIDAKAVEKAVKGGDSAALQQILRGVLSTAEGQRLAENIRKMMKK